MEKQILALPLCAPATTAQANEIDARPLIDSPLHEGTEAVRRLAIRVDDDKPAQITTKKTAHAHNCHRDKGRHCGAHQRRDCDD